MPSEDEAGIPADSTSYDSGTFPHPDGWEGPASHGSWVLNHDPADCFVCHKVTSDLAEAAPACSSCHHLYPHAEGWSEGASHGAEVLNNGRGNCTTQCHGYDMKGGLSGISCDGCHTLYPHNGTWGSAKEHGEAARGNGQSLCKGCHGDDLQGGNSGASCTQCHPNYPHAAGWGDAGGHGTFVSENGQDSCATQCHGTDLEGGLSQVSCNDCHTLFPHDANWETDHQTSALTLGKEVCQKCHGTDFKALLGGQNCFSCHADYPHPDEPVWEPFSGGHGERVRVNYGGDTAACEPCHGADLKTMKEGRNCFSCHPSYPHEKMVPQPWNESGGHGNYALQHTRDECQDCHGSDYAGGSRSNPSCYDCHVDYPHVGGWDHGPNAQEDGGHIAECKKCHGAGLDDAPDGYQSCDDCHPSYLRHANADTGYVGWENGGTDRHGSNYILDSFGRFIPYTRPYTTTQARTAECRLCHGDGDQAYQGGVSGRSCMDVAGGCHTTDMDPPGASPQDNWPMMIFQCNACHALPPSGWGDFYPENPECLACHSDVSAPHYGWVNGSPNCRDAGCHDDLAAPDHDE